MTKDEILIKAGSFHGAYIAYAFSFLRNWTAAEDVVQDAYVVFTKNWEKFTSDSDSGAMKAWGRGVVRNKCREYVRANRKESVVSVEYIEDLDNLIDSGMDSIFRKENSYMLENQIALLKGCISNLSQSSRDLLREFYICGRRSIDIAKDKGQHPGSAKVQLSRLRKQLRNCMQEKTMESQTECEILEPDESLDSFFTEEPSAEDFERVMNMLQTEKGRQEYFSYVAEWSVFTSTLSELKEDLKKEKKTDDAKGTPSLPVITESFVESETSDGVMVSFDSPKQDTTRRLTIAGSIAACLTLIFWGSWFVAQKQKAIATIATITEIENNTTNGESLLKQGKKIYLNEPIKIPTGVECQLSLIGEDTTLQLSDQAEFQFASSKEGKLVQMRTGTLEATIARQVEEYPLTFQTPHANITVLGTRFRLQVNKSTSKIALMEGRLKLSSRNSDESKILTSGDQAIIEAGTPFIVNNPNMKTTPRSNTNDYLIENTNGLIAWYRFEGNEKNTILDSSPFKAHGYLEKHLAQQYSIRTSGKWGNGVHYPNVDIANAKKGSRVIQFPDFPKDKIGKELSVVFWIKHNVPVSPNAFGSFTNFPPIMSCRNAELGRGWFISHLYANQDRHLLALFVNCSTTEIFERKVDHKKAASGHYPHTINEWTHVAITFKSGEVNFYIDGKLQSSSVIAETEIFTPSANAIFGVGPYNGPSFYMLDEVAIFNHSIDIREAKAFYETR